MVVNRVPKSNVEIDLAFFLILILKFSGSWKRIFLWLTKILDVVSESGFVLEFFEAKTNLAPMGVLCILGNQYLIWSVLSSSAMFRSNILQ